MNAAEVTNTKNKAPSRARQIFLIWSPVAMLVVLFAPLAGIWFYMGVTFVAGLHFFGWLLHFAVGLAAISLVLAVWLAFGLAMRQSLGVRARELIVTAALALLLASAGSFPVMAVSLATGRHLAYSSTDTVALHRACRQLVARNAKWRDQHFYIDQGDDDWESVPGFLRRLSPCFVRGTRDAVVVQMDGGGVACHEGFFVVLNAPDGPIRNFARENSVRILDERQWVFRYEEYDHRRCLDAIPLKRSPDAIPGNRPSTAVNDN